MGEIVDFNDITVTETDSFQRGNKSIDILKGLDGNILVFIQAGDIKKRNKGNISLNGNDACLTNNGKAVSRTLKTNLLTDLL